MWVDRKTVLRVYHYKERNNGQKNERVQDEIAASTWSKDAHHEDRPSL